MQRARCGAKVGTVKLRHLLALVWALALGVASVVTARSGIAARAAGEPREVALGGVAAVHPREHAVAARLERQVQVLAHRPRTRPSPRWSRDGGPSGAAT